MDFKHQLTQLDDAKKKRKRSEVDTPAPQHKVDPVSLQRAIENPSAETLTPDVITSLHTTHGNQFVSRLLQRVKAATTPATGGLVVQMDGLTVTPANDKYEQEADKVSKAVVNQINSGGADVQREGEEDELAMKRIQREGEEEELAMKRIQREGEEEELAMKRIQREGEEEELAMKRIQRLSDDDPMGGETVSSEIEGSIESARGSGSAMDDSTRSKMEGAFNADFSGVRVHTDSQSDTLNQSIQAKAFTTGQDIFMRSDSYSPGTSSGQELLAHELTHVVQQNGASVQRDKEDKGKK